MRRCDAALGALVVALGGCSHGAASAASPSPEPVSVETTVAPVAAVQPRLELPGIIVPFQTVGVSSALSEPIVRVLVREGDVVRAGQVLAILETDDLQASLAAARQAVAENAARTAQTAYGAGAAFVQSSTDVRSAVAALRQAQVNLASAQHDLARDRELATNGYLPQQTYDQQLTVVATDREAVTSARASLLAAQATQRANGDDRSGAQAAQLAGARAAQEGAAESARQIERTIARATIVAPVDGVVESVNANPGEYPSGRQLFTIEQNATVYALLSAPGDDAFSIRRNARAVVTPHGAQASFSGSVSAILDQVQPGSTNFSIKVLLANGDGTLHAGMPVSATVFAPVVRGVRIPVTAFVDDDRTQVWSIDGHTVRGRPVTQRATDGTYAVVAGLPAGTRIVKNAQQTGVSDGDTVTF